MPLVPRGLSRRLLDRLRERSRDVLERRVIDPLRRKIEDVAEEWGLGILPQGPPKDLADVMRRVQLAGRKNLLLLAQYNGHYRKLEPYSYRYRDRKYPGTPLLYAYCYKDQGIEAFHLPEFTDMRVTEEPFVPRWEVEF